jgi:hypothetical protein
VTKKPDLRVVPNPEPAPEARASLFTALIHEHMEWAFRVMGLRKWMFHSAEEMAAAGLSDQDIRAVQAWNEHKEIPYGLKTAVDQVEAYVKSTGGDTDVRNSLNAENVPTVALPEKRSDVGPRTVVKVEPGDR